MITSGEVYRLSVSDRKGSKKNNIAEALLMENFGIAGDAHAGSERQVSLLPYEAFDVIRERLPDIEPGDFAENITTRGVDFSTASVGDRLCIGTGVQLVITQIGKECHNDCPIRQAVGDCIMPRQGIFASIVKGGLIRVGDIIRWENDDFEMCSDGKRPRAAGTTVVSGELGGERAARRSVDGGKP